jgi:tetratricopeptide (TPR) repeat protein
MKQYVVPLSLLCVTAFVTSCGSPPASQSPPPPTAKPATAVVDTQSPIDPTSDLKEQPNVPTSTAPKQMSFEEASKRIEETTKANPKSYSVQMQAVQFYMSVERFDAAIPHLQIAVTLSPRVFPWIALGDCATIVGKFDLAHKAYDTAEKIDPGNAKVMRGKGQLYVAQRKFAEGQKFMENALKKYPRSTAIRAALGNLYIVLGKPVKAIETLEPAVQQEPTNTHVRSLLADSYAKNLHLESAIKQYQEIVKVDSKNAMAWGQMGLFMVNLTRYEEAREPLNRAIQIDPMEPHYYWALGDSWLLESTDDAHFDKASQYYRQALRLNPDNGKALYSFAMGLSRRGRPTDLEECIPLFRRLIQINPSDMNAHFKLAEALRLTGKTDEAKTMQAKFLVLFDKGRKQNRDLYRRASYKDTAENHVRLGQNALKEQNYKVAKLEFEAALQRDETLADAKRGLMEAMKALGTFTEEKKPTQ